MESSSDWPVSEQSHRQVERWIVAALCAIALALRLAPAFQNRFHADEALYASWAMQVASGRDVLLASVPIDKPPLSMYAMAAGLSAFGWSELAARLPNLIASVLSVGLVWRWAQALYPRLSGALSSSLILHPSSLAALSMALSPFSIAFGGTAFLDPLMVMWGLAACVAAGRGRAGWGGVFLGLAFATKVQGLLFVPLVMITAEFAEDAENRKTFALSASSAVQKTLPIAVGFFAVVGLVLIWSLLRGRTPFWVQQAINYGGIRPAFASEIGSRLGGWLELLPFLFGPAVGVMLMMGVLALLVHAFRRVVRSRAAAIDLWLIAYVLGFLALHWLLAFPVWDRYLLILVPVGAVLLARVGRLVARSLSHSLIANRPDRRSLVFGAIVAAAIAPFSLSAARSQIPIGGDHGSHDGVDRVAAYLRGLPVGTVVYDHWLGWEFEYYLWDAPLYRAYFETPDRLARDLRVFGRTSTRYIVFPASESTRKIERAIGAEGFQLTPVLATTDRFGRNSFTVYQITSQ
jgi:4-amino-4-deoxy-L-arabinose transferase-like glycosyltransferase